MIKFTKKPMKHMTRLALSAVTSLVALLAFAVQPGWSQSPPAQGGRIPRVVYVPPLPSPTDTAHYDFNVIIVKFREGSGVRLRSGRLSAPLQTSLVPLNSVLQGYPGTTTARLFRKPEAQLDQERLAGLAASNIDLADLNLYHEFILPPGTSPTASLQLVKA